LRDFPFSILNKNYYFQGPGSGGRRRRFWV